METVFAMLFDAEFGIELESLRVTEDAFIAKSEHPFNSSHISKDFAECQMEFITDVYDSVEKVYEALSDIFLYARKELYCKNPKEYIWPLSVPPHIYGKDIPEARFYKEERYRQEYRKYLAGKYDVKKLLFSGIHFNFSFSENNLQGFFDGTSTYIDYKNRRYLRLSKEAVKYAWLVVLLTGASPIYDISLIDDEHMDKTVSGEYSTIRCSSEGYWNAFDPVLDYTTLKGYVDSIQKYIDEGLIISESEFYYPVRMKSKGGYSLSNLMKYGADYIEFRLMDINPLSPYGIMPEDIRFLHMMFIYLDRIADDGEWKRESQLDALSKIKQAAMYDNSKLMSEAGYILTDMKDYFLKNGADESYLNALDFQLEKINDESRLYSRIIKNAAGDNVSEYGIGLAKYYTLLE